MAAAGGDAMSKRTRHTSQAGRGKGYRAPVRRSRTGWWVAAAAVATLMLVGWVGLRGHGTVRATGVVGTAVGDTAPPFSVKDIQGQTVTLAAGKPTLMYFVAAWCSSCSYGDTQLRQVYDRYGHAVRLITVDVDPQQDTPQMVATFAKNYGGPWPAVLDQGERLTQLYHVTSLDSSYLVNAQGVIVYAAQAPLTAAAWDNRLQPLVSRAGTA